MSHLSKLKIVAQAAKRQQTKTEHRRGKLLEKLDDQLAMVQALIDGEIFTRNRRVWQKNEAGDTNGHLHRPTWAQSRMPIDLIVSGNAMSLFHASHAASMMAS